MKAIILAAGEGKRLRPLTNNIPKCMVKLGGKSILERQIELFRKCGIDDISIVRGYQKEKITFPNITYFENLKYDSTNMVETLFCARKKLYDSVIISYGDIIFEKKVLEKIIDAKDDVSIIIDLEWRKIWELRFDNILEDAESLVMDNENNILDIGQKVKKLEEIQGQYIGLMKFQNAGVEFLKKFYDECKKRNTNIINPNIPFEKSYMTDLIQGLIKTKCKIKAITIKNGWIEIDTFKDYKIYNEKIYDGTIKKIIDLDN